jgi:membrane-associated phospholipid phosphatase
MTYGIVAIKSDFLQHINTDIRDEFTEDIDEKVTIDDFSQYAPAVAVYALNNIGVGGRHDLRDRSIILATGYAMMATTVLVLKPATRFQRPDGTSFNSFPSGHTATAFLGAEFLWQEYKDVSVWYGITGYAVAAGTGYFRMYNGRHWLSDVAMGAGIGILSAKAAYWMFPYLNRKLFSRSRRLGFITPFCNGRQVGLGVCLIR